MIIKVPERTLRMFVDQKFHWKSLSHEQQLSMAEEILRQRRIMNELVRLGNRFEGIDNEMDKA